MSNDLTSQLLALQDMEQVRDNPLRSPFAYPGAKTRSIQHLLAELPYRNTFIDACGGSGSVLFARNSCALEVFNERHAGIVAMYRCIRDVKKCKELLDRCQAVPSCSREEFLYCRDSWNQAHHDDVERAARWYYSVCHSFNSKGWSFGRVVKGRAQCGKYWNNLDLFWKIHNRMRNVQIENLDYRLLFKDYKRGGHNVVWYIDPPYWGTSGCYEHEWTKDQHFELCERIQDLDGGFVAISGYDHPDHPYNKCTIWTKKIQWEVAVSMTGFAFTETNNLKEYENDISRGKATETLWIYDPK